MPEITLLGWFHTALGTIAIVAGIVALARYKEIMFATRSGFIYLFATVITAGTALAIFQHGGFGPAHGLAVMTLGAVFIGAIADLTDVLGKAGRYVRAVAYSSTLLFHAIPAVTDASLRLPVGDPFLTSIEDPFLRGAYLTLLVLLLIGVTIQVRWIRRQSR